MASLTEINPQGQHRVIVTKPLPGTRWLEVLKKADCHVIIHNSEAVLSQDEIKNLIGERCDGAIGQLTEAWNEDLFQHLKAAGGRAFSNYAVGYNNVDVSGATKNQIPVGNTPGVLTETTAECAAALVYAAARRISESEVYLRQGKFTGWSPDLFLGKRLWGSTLGIVGSGRIGISLAKMLAPGNNMDVVYYSRSASPELENWFSDLNEFRQKQGERTLSCHRHQELDSLLETSDIISLHVPLTVETQHLIDSRRLKLCKPDAILVNTARGPVIDEQALVAHLREQPEFRVGLDVFEKEPEMAPGLTELDNAVIVPHIGSATRWTREGMATLAASNVAAILNNKPVAENFDVEEYLSGSLPIERAPSIVNGEELGLAVG